MSDETRYFFLTSDSGGDEVADTTMANAAATWALEEFGGEVGNPGSIEDVEADLLAGKPNRFSVPDLEARGVVFGDDHPPTVPQIMEWLDVDAERARGLLRRCNVVSGETFLLEIKMGNAGMQSPKDVSDVLTEVARKVETEGRWEGDVFDSNGNSVGTYRLGAKEGV